MMLILLIAPRPHSYDLFTHCQLARSPGATEPAALLSGPFHALPPPPPSPPDLSCRDTSRSPGKCRAARLSNCTVPHTRAVCAKSCGLCSALVVPVQVATLIDGRLPIPQAAGKVFVEVGSSDRNTLDLELLPDHAGAFLVSCSSHRQILACNQPTSPSGAGVRPARASWAAPLARDHLAHCHRPSSSFCDSVRLRLRLGRSSGRAALRWSPDLEGGRIRGLLVPHGRPSRPPTTPEIDVRQGRQRHPRTRSVWPVVRPHRGAAERALPRGQASPNPSPDPKP